MSLVFVTFVAVPTTMQAYTYVLKPSAEQEEALLSHLGASRFAYNHLLSLVLDNWDENRQRKELGEEVSPGDWIATNHFGLTSKWMEVRDEVAPWWRENGHSAYNDAAQRLSRAFANFYQGKSKLPKYKKRGQGESVRIVGTALKLINTHCVCVSRVGEIRTYESTRKLARHINDGTGRIVAGCVSRRAGRWQISFTVEIQRNITEMRVPIRVIGVDLGIAALGVGSDPNGNEILRVDNPRYLIQSESKLRYLQREASRKQGPRRGQGSSNRWKKAQRQVQATHRRIANQRLNLIHQTTTHLAKNYDRIVIEDLNVKGMMSNHALAKHVSDSSFGEFRRQLTYKCHWYGAELLIADRFYPSSKTCRSCGAVKAKLPLADRTFRCDQCGAAADRDLNAATNLARWPSEAISAGTDSVAGRGGKVRPARDSFLVREAHPGESSTEVQTKVGI